jgi:beta-glucosidase
MVRAEALVALLTLKEKVAQLQNAAPAISRLGIPAYDWWSESLHGVARNGRATVFPQAIGLAATFDEGLVGRVARAISDEARAKFAAAHATDGAAAAAGTARYQGLTFFAPNVNIVRDPRWGRGQETYGEDPFLTARLAVAYVRGLQGDDPRSLRTAAVAKHFAAHSGPEWLRHRFDAHVDAHDLTDTYLPQFEALVREGRVAGIMAAYNRINGEPCVASPTLLTGILRRQWGFDGFVVGDCGAVGDVVAGHGAARDEMHAAALALRAGTDLDCGSTYRHLADAVGAGLVTESEIDRAVARLFAVRFRLGLLDPPSDSGTRASGATARWSTAETDAPGAHVALAREAAQKSLVLLTNDGVLPIGAGVHRIAIVGPLADDVHALLGTYHGDPVTPVTVLAGIRAAARFRGIGVDAVAGVSLSGRSLAGLNSAVSAARAADLVIAVLGLSPLLEGEAGDPDGGNALGDRQDLGLPGAQPALLAALLRTGKPTVVVLTGGSAIALPDQGAVPNAVLLAWYPGEQGGNAVADALFGDISPSGRLPITFYRSVKDLPPFADYGMAGRTYRYYEGKTLFSFGHGLGYSAVAYRDLRADRPAVSGSSPGAAHPEAAASPVVVHATLENHGARAVEEVVQVYATPRPRRPGDPLRSLVAFRRVALSAGENQSVDMNLPPQAFTRVGRDGARQAVEGTWDLQVKDLSVTVDLSR